MKISNILGREILDSRGNPTVEVDLQLEDESFGRAIVPSGASKGEHEATEIRDNDKSRYNGKGVLTAVNNINNVVRKAIKNIDFKDQGEIDNFLIELDGTDNKSKLGANAILGISIAFAKAIATSNKVELFNSFSNEHSSILPIPMINILNGGSHANNNIDIQEFMIFPIGAESFSSSLQMGAEVFHSLKSVLNQKNLNTAVGDEGGFAPNLRSNSEALDIILTAIDKTPYEAGKDIYLALDIAASEIYKNGLYSLSSEKQLYSSDEMIEYLKLLINNYPIISIEDGLDQNDWNGWKKLTNEIGKSCQIVGDDLTVTSTKLLNRAIDEKSMNAILVKLNQIGSVTETIEAVNIAKENSFGTIISHRSGETEDTTIADFAVSLGAGQIKTGSISRTDRIAKYNQLLRIEEALGSKAIFPGKEVLGKSFND